MEIDLVMHDSCGRVLYTVVTKRYQIRYPLTVLNRRKGRHFQTFIPRPEIAAPHTTAASIASLRVVLVYGQQTLYGREIGVGVP